MPPVAPTPDSGLSSPETSVGRRREPTGRPDAPHRMDPRALQQAISQATALPDVRQRAQATPVLRIGHFVLRVKDAGSELKWFMDHFALVESDYICAPGDPDPIVKGTFLRYARGMEFVEHHCILINESALHGCHHSSYEVLDLDAVLAGHDFLVQKGWNLDAGVGRHHLGSLIYDYWLDPFGNRIEHYTDTDLINDDYKPVYFVGGAHETTQWGMAPPPSFFD